MHCSGCYQILPVSVISSIGKSSTAVNWYGYFERLSLRGDKAVNMMEKRRETTISQIDLSPFLSVIRIMH